MPDDPIKRYVDHGLEELPVSPMAPPEAYSPPKKADVSYEELAAPLRVLWDEHEQFLKVLSAFDHAFVSLKENAWKVTPEISAVFRDFFKWVDEQLVSHERKEEKGLFPILQEKLLEAGECSPGEKPVTPVDIMEDEHTKVSQSIAIIFTLLGLAPRLQDEKSRTYLFEQTFQLAQEVVETMKLHIFRENTILFPMAQQFLSDTEFSTVNQKIEQAK